VQYTDILVEPKNLQREANEEWRIKHVSDVGKEGWTIQNVATGKYAWDPEPPHEHEPVHQNDSRRLWKIKDLGEGHVIITPVGSKEDILFWTELQENSDTPVTLEQMTGPKSLWILSPVKYR